MNELDIPADHDAGLLLDGAPRPLFPLFLRRRLTGVQELMEDPACDQVKLHRTYAQFRAINALVSGWRRIYTRHLRPAAAAGRATLLDVGFGGGDVPLRLARWAARDGIALEVTAIDTDPRALAWVARQRRPKSVRFRGGTLEDVRRRGQRFDFVISSHLLHHLTPPAFTAFCHETARLSRRLVIHNDIVRSAVAFLSFAALTVPFFHRSFIVPDGLTSIRRSYTRQELRRLAPFGWSVTRVFPYHQLLVLDRTR